jgi:hypothetical protein
MTLQNWAFSNGDGRPCDRLSNRLNGTRALNNPASGNVTARNDSEGLEIPYA